MTGTTNITGKVYIATDSSGDPDPQSTVLTGSEFAALTYTQIPNVGNVGDTGVGQNLVTYSTWDNTLAIKQKGEATGNDVELRVLDESSAGMTALKSAGAVSDQNNYAFKIEWSDGSIEYNRGVVSAPSFPKGANEDFKEAVFTIGLNQEPVFA